MKTVINAKETVTTAIDCADYDAFFLAHAASGLYILRRESDGWIFRSASEPIYCHSGYHESPRRAIERALLAGATKIFQFDNFVELAQYVVSHTKL